MKPILHLTLRREPFDMILSGKKKEEYRDIKPHWKRIFSPNTIKIKGEYYKAKDVSIIFSNGYNPDRAQISVQCRGLEIAYGKSRYGGDPDEKYFVLKLGAVKRMRRRREK